jgi:hypothetical protein
MTSLTHKEMTSHIRNRLKASKIPARVRLYTACSTNYIHIFGVKSDSVWTSKQAQEINLIAAVNNLTGARRSNIDHSDAYWSQVKEWRGDFHFEFHGVQS